MRTADAGEAMARARAVGTELGLGGMLDRPASALTVAGRKRLEVARALATRPRLLLLDEVMAGLNPSEIHEIVAMIRGIREGGVTVLLIEHIMQAVAALADDVYVLAQGALIAQGSPRAIADDPAVIEAYRFAQELPTRRTVDVEQFCSWSAWRMNRTFRACTTSS